MSDRRRTITVEAGKWSAAFLAALIVVGLGLPLAVIELGGPEYSPIGKALATHSGDASLDLGDGTLFDDFEDQELSGYDQTIDRKASGSWSVTNNTDPQGDYHLYREVFHGSSEAYHSQATIFTNHSFTLEQNESFTFSTEVWTEFVGPNTNWVKIWLQDGSGNRLELYTGDGSTWTVQGALVEDETLSTPLSASTWGSIRLEVDYEDELVYVYADDTLVGDVGLSGEFDTAGNIDFYARVYANRGVTSSDHYTRLRLDDVTVTGEGPPASRPTNSSLTTSTNTLNDDWEDYDSLEWIQTDSGSSVRDVLRSSIHDGAIEGNFTGYYRVKIDTGEAAPTSGTAYFDSPTIDHVAGQPLNITFLAKYAYQGGKTDEDLYFELRSESGDTIRIEPEGYLDGTLIGSRVGSGGYAENSLWRYTLIYQPDNSVELRINGTTVATADVTGFFNGNMTFRMRLAVQHDTTGNTDQTEAWVDDLNFKVLGKGLSGKVVNQEGEPVAGATVEIWQIKDSELNADPGETTAEAARDLTENLTRAVPRDRFNPSLDPINSEQFTGDSAGRMVLIHEPAAWYAGNVEVLGQSFPIGTPTRGLDRPLIQLEPDTTYAFSIWDRSEDPFIEDAVDRKVEPGVSESGTVVVEQIGPGNSVIQRYEKETTDQVRSFTGKRHEYVELSLPTGYYVVRPKQGGAPIVIQAGSPEKIPRHFNQDLKTADGATASIAKYTQDKIAAGALKRVTVTTDSQGRFSVDVPATYSTVAITAFDGQGLTDGITNPSLNDLRTQIQQQDYNGSIYLSSSPKVVEPPVSGVTITVVEIKRPTFSDLQAYLELFSWLEDLVDEEAFNRLSTLWTDPSGDVTNEELETRAKELDDLVRQNGELEERLERLVSENEDLTKTVGEIRDQLEGDSVSEGELKEYLDDLTEAVQTSQPTINVNVEEPELEVPESDSEPTLLNLRLPIETRAGEDSTLTKEGVTVLVHFDNGTSSTMNESYWRIDNSIGASQGTGSEVVIEDYPIPADVAVASIELLVANDQGVGREQVSIDNPGFEGTPPELASINVGSMRPGPDERVSITVTPTDSSTYQKIAGASAYAPDGSELSTTVTGSKVTFTTNGSGSHLVQLKVSDGSRNYTETIRIKAGSESIDYPASVRIHDGVLGRTLIASDGVDSAEIDVSRGGSAARITAKVDDSDVPNEIHIHGKEITGLQQDLTVSVVSSSDEARISRDVLLKLHLSKLSDEAIVYVHGEPITADGNKYGKVSDEGDSTLITTVARGGAAKVEINNNPSIVERIWFTAQVEIGQRLPDVPLITISPPLAGGAGVSLV